MPDLSGRLLKPNRCMEAPAYSSSGPPLRSETSRCDPYCEKERVIDCAGRVRGIKGRRWLVIACETKIVFQDLMGGPSKEVPRSVMDGRPSTRIAFTFIHSPSLLGEEPGLRSDGAICKLEFDQSYAKLMHKHVRFSIHASACNAILQAPTLNVGVPRGVWQLACHLCCASEERCCLEYAPANDPGM